MKKLFNYFTTYELILIAIIATLGIALKPIIVPITQVISGILMLPGGALVGGLYMFWLVLGFGLIGKYGTGTLIALVQALVVLFSGSVGSHGIMSLLSYTMPGVIMDLGIFLIGHRLCCKSCAFIAGLLANVTGTFIVNRIFIGSPSSFLVLVLLVAALSGGLGGLLAWKLLEILERYHITPRYNKENTKGGADN